MTLLETIQAELTDFGKSVEAAKADGVQFSDAISLTTEAVTRGIVVAQQFGGTGEEKKAALKQVTKAAYAKFIAPLDLPWIPGFAEVFVDAAVMEAIDPIIDRIVAALWAVKIFKD